MHAPLPRRHRASTGVVTVAAGLVGGAPTAPTAPRSRTETSAAAAAAAAVRGATATRAARTTTRSRALACYCESTCIAACTIARTVTSRSPRLRWVKSERASTSTICSGRRNTRGCWKHATPDSPRSGKGGCRFVRVMGWAGLGARAPHPRCLDGLEPKIAKATYTARTTRRCCELGVSQLKSSEGNARADRLDAQSNLFFVVCSSLKVVKSVKFSNAIDARHRQMFAFTNIHRTPPPHSLLRAPYAAAHARGDLQAPLRRRHRQVHAERDGPGVPSHGV